MKTYNIDIQEGDYVIDPINKEIRQVKKVDQNGTTIWMEDGGVMGRNEIKEVYLNLDEIGE